MPFDVNGIWTRPVDPDTGAEYNFTADLAAGEPRSIVEATDMDAHFDDLKVALSETFLRDGRAPMTGNLKIGTSADTTETRQINVGVDRTGNGYSLINLIGDATYPIYGARLVRHNAGPDALTTLDTRGTGGLRISVQEAGPFSVRTTDTDRFRIKADGDADFFGTGTETRIVKIGHARSGDGASYLYLISDTTYSVYGTRIYRNAGANGWGGITHRGTGSFRVGTEDGGRLLLHSNGIDRMQFNTDSIITIKESTGGILTKGLTSGQASLGTGTSATDAAWFGPDVIYIQNAAHAMRLSRNGGTGGYILFYRSNVQIGNIRTDDGSTTVYSTTSDRRMKDKIKFFEHASDILRDLKVREFEFKTNPGVRRVGLIAQEAIKIWSQNVGYDEENDVYSIGYGDYTPLLIGGWQNHERRISDLEREVALLRG